MGQAERHMIVILALTHSHARTRERVGEEKEVRASAA